MIGQSISHYQVIKKIGEGGMGVVYLVQDKNLQRQCALKLLSPEAGFSAETKRRFKREAQAISILNHPNIITIFELGEFNGLPYIIMEYIDGRSLRDVLEEKKLNLQEALILIKQICHGLSKAHFAGIVHRDLKPENILIDKTNTIKILDFGLAKLKGSTRITKEHSLIGTIQYMSPEQIQGAELDIRSDIFSLGIIFYEMVTGRLPFKGDQDVSLMYSVVHDTAAPIRDAQLLLVKNIINKAINKKLSLRYQTAETFLDDIIEYERTVRMPDPSEVVLNPVNQSIEELLAHREKIDALIEKEHKKDSVIMFCDMVGSTQYFEEYGDIEGRAMVKRFTTAAFPLINEFNGQVIKTMGDGILAAFDDPAASCFCAIELQKKMAEDNIRKEKKDQILIRVALHYGKVVVDDNDVYGDVVNVAARVESQTKPRQILLSQTLHKIVKGQAGLEFASAGDYTFKGKSKPMQLFRLRWYEDENIDAPTQVDKSVAEAIVIKKKYTTPLPEFGNISSESKNKNPYMNRVMIRDSEDFFGRKNEIAKIYSRIGSARPQSVSLVGERRIGKSSLLNFIYNPVNRRQYLENPDQYIFLFIDFQEKRGIDVPEFFATIFDSLIKEFKGELEINLDPDYESFEKIIIYLDKQGFKIIMLFDEFELVTKNKNFKADFYSYARSLANNYNVAYLVASGRNLQTVCHSREISDSPFFNIFSNINLGQFNKPELIDLVNVPSKRAGNPLEAYVDFVYDIAGFYPFFIQMACASLFDFVCENGRVSKRKFEEVKEEFLDEAQVHFQQIWDVYDEDCHDVFLRLASKKPIAAQQEYLITPIQKSGYIKIENNKPVIFSSLFSRFILDRYNSSLPRKKSRFSFWPFN
jgi:serine/threonine protein kinase/AAA+ ATPase superfamily predicted ATPase